MGDRRNYCVTLIAIDPEDLEVFAQQKGIPVDQNHQAVLDAVQGQVDEVNKGLVSFESIKYFRLTPEPLSIANGLLTASLKVKRKVVEERYADLIDDMYASGKKPSA